MKTIPISDGKNSGVSDFSLVELRDDGNIGKLTPHCKKHGAMNKVSKNGYWRCLRAEMVKTTKIKKGVYKSKRVGDCRAGCREVKINGGE